MSGGAAANRIEAPGIEAPGIEALRARIRVLERGGKAAALRVLPLGPQALDERLPGGGLPLTGLHEIEGERAEWDDGVASAFCLALLARLAAAREGYTREGRKRPVLETPVLAGPILWAAAQDDLYAPGLAGFGLDPELLLLVRAGNDRDVLWALEEGLRSGALGAVVGEVTALDRTAGRRLQLAAEAAGLPCFLLRRPRLAGRGREGPSAAVTRWRVAPQPSVLGPSEAETEGAGGLIGRPRWQVALLRCRGAAPAGFVMEWDHATGAFALAAALRDGPLGPRPADGDAPAGRSTQLWRIAV